MDIKVLSKISLINLFYDNYLKKWLELGKGDNAEWVLRGATDAQEYYQTCNSDYKQLMLSYDFEWLKQHYESKY